MQREQKFYDKMEKLMLDSNELIDEAEQKNSTRTTLAESYYVPKTELVSGKYSFLNYNLRDIFSLLVSVLDSQLKGCNYLIQPIYLT